LQQLQQSFDSHSLSDDNNGNRHTCNRGPIKVIKEATTKTAVVQSLMVTVLLAMQ